MAMDDAAFTTALNDSRRPRARLAHAGEAKRASFPLGLMLARQFVGDRIALSR
jgi:2-polyprenyl-6-methoxyphenol hydroxylase-like FAD-dependent oxidoreductase